MPKPLNLIVACAENRVIGREGRLPWRIPEDFAFFEHETAGNLCIIGRVCFESWTRATLDGRTPIVLTSRPLHPRPLPELSPGEPAPTAPLITRSFPEALALADSLPGEIHVCGGERIYAESLALAGIRPLRLLLTLVHAAVEGDTYFPEWRHLPWRELSRRESADANFRYTFLTLELSGGL